MRKLRPLLGTLLLCAAPLTLACSRSEADASPGDRSGGGRGGGPPRGMPGGFGGGEPAAAMPVEVASVERRSISDFIETNGTLEAENEVDIIARIAGPITSLRAEEGQRVRAGQVLAEIDREEVLADLSVAQVNLEEKRIAFERAKLSWENEVIAKEAFDLARSSLDSAEAQLRSIEIQLEYTTIRAPFSGLIIERVIKAAEHVPNGARLFRISDFDPLLCPIQIPEKDLGKLRKGQPALLEVEAYEDERFEAKVLRVSPVVDAATGTVKVTLEVAGRDLLRPGMFANVFLETDVHEDALVIPKQALVLESIGDTVYVLEEGVARRREIEIGYEETDALEVMGGLGLSDRVVVIGQDALSDGTPAYVLSEQPDAPPQPAADGWSGASGSGGAAGGPPGGPPAGSPGPGGAPSEEMIQQIKQRMKERGLTDEQIEKRLQQMRGSGGPGAGRPGASAGPGSPAAPGRSARPEASSSQEAPAASPDELAADADPDRLEAVRERLRERGQSETDTAEGRAAGARRGPPGAMRPGGGPGGPGGGELTPERIEFMKARMRDRGMSEEQIEQMIERMKRGESPFPDGRRPTLDPNNRPNPGASPPSDGGSPS